jgi:predicted metal-dependent enzyme (double-stranded beta helix superfamily)
MPLIHPALLGHEPAVDGLPPALARDLLRDREHVLDAETLLTVTRSFAASRVWVPIARHDPQRRWYTRLMISASVEVWLICWYPGQGTAVHDHGGALGALTVADGAVDETVHHPRDWSVTTARRRYRRGDSATFAARHVHQVVNVGSTPATTVHAYSPPELPVRYEPAAAGARAAAAVDVAMNAPPPGGAGQRTTVRA